MRETGAVREKEEVKKVAAARAVEAKVEVNKVYGSYSPLQERTCRQRIFACHLIEDMGTLQRRKHFGRKAYTATPFCRPIESVCRGGS